MFPFKQTFDSPKERSKGTNTKEFICLHHTGTKEGTIKGVLDGLYKRDDYASCHFVVDTNGDAYKIGSPDDILWHVGESSWNGRTDINRFAIGIEIIGPLSDGGFTNEQRKTVRALVQHLMAVFKIPQKNVLRHADFCHAGSPKGILWDGKSKSRKVDCASTFFLPKSFSDWRNELIPKQI